MSTQPGDSQQTVSSHTGTQTQTQLPTLVLRAEPVEARHIAWDESVVDNEGLGKKSSKVCCIWHPPNAAGESSQDSSSSSSSDESDASGNDDGRALPAGGAGKRPARRRHHKHRHSHSDDEDHPTDGEGEDSKGGDKRARRKTDRRPSPNAYERVPKINNSKRKDGEPPKPNDKQGGGL